MANGTIDDMLRDAAGVVDNTINGKCSNCGECCSDFLPVSQTDLKRIKAYVAKHNIVEHKNNVVQAGVDFTCPFRDNVKRVCTIYEVRPAICREFKCDYSPARLADNKEFFHDRYKPVSMRHEVYGNNDSQDMFVRLLGAFAGLTGRF